MLMRRRAIGTVAYLGGLPALLEPFCWAWSQLVQYNAEYLCEPGEYVHYDRATVSLHDVARNMLVDRMAGDWLLQLDTDHIFEPDLAARMVSHMRTYDLQVAVGLYRHKHPPSTPVIYNWNADATFALPIGDWDRESGIRALQIGTAGGGCLMVKRSVFDRIRTELQEQPFTRFQAFGEDHAFFKRCHALGIPVHALVNVEAPHLALRSMPMTDYERPDAALLQQVEAGGLR